MAKSWIIVAAGCRARVFACADHSAPLEEVFALSHPPARPSTGPSDNRCRRGRERFAAELAGVVHRGWQKGRFERLYVLADPKIVAALRETLEPRVQNRIVGEIPRNLIRMPADTIRAHLPDSL